MRPTWAEIDLSAVRHNIAVLRDLVAPAEVCAVVKADGYGHGSVPVARAALAAGATCLAVALVEEGAELRAAGITAPILLLSEPPVLSACDVLDLDLEPTVYSGDGIDALAWAVRAADPDGDGDGSDGVTQLRVHLKVNTGMHRVGADPADAVALALAIDARPELRLASVWTHCAVADEPDNPFTGQQLARYDAAVEAIEAGGVTVPMRHAANSAAAIAHPAARHDLVRCGIAVYGLDASPALSGMAPLRPAMRLASRVAHVKQVAAGEAISYGQRYRLERPSIIATVPIGYADGVPRALGANGGEVLIGGKRRPIAGTITMDQIMVDCGDDRDVAVGDEVVFLGAQGSESIAASEWARRTGTIDYEIVCAISTRVPRRYLHEEP